jgi:hypothetical protein
MNVKVQNGILKQVQNDTLVMPNPAYCGTSHLSFGFDLTFELCHLTFQRFNDA